MRGEPVSCSENPTTQSNLNVKLIYLRTVEEYILSMLPLIEVKMLLRTFSVMCDGWSDNKIHYAAILFTCVHYKKYCQALNVFVPLLNRGDFNFNQHVDFSNGSLSVYSKSLGSVAYLINGSCSVNQRLF